MPTNLLVLPLLGGFCFVHFCYFFRFRAQRLDGYRLVLESALYGALLSLPARLITYYWPRFFSTGSFVRAEWGHLWKAEPLSGTACVSLMLGLFVPLLINWLHATSLQLPDESAWAQDERNPKRKVDKFLEPAKVAARVHAIRDFGNDLQELLYKAVLQEDPILVTSANRRVHVGYVTEIPTLKPENEYLSLLVVLSGYRHHETLKVVFDLAYPDPEEVKRAGGIFNFDPNDMLLMVIPFSEVTSASLYHQDLQRFFLPIPPS